MLLYPRQHPFPAHHYPRLLIPKRGIVRQIRLVIPTKIRAGLQPIFPNPPRRFEADSAGSIESPRRRIKKKRGGRGGGISANITRHQEMPGIRKIVLTITWKKRKKKQGTRSVGKGVKKKRKWRREESLRLRVNSSSFVVGDHHLAPKLFDRRNRW